MPKVIDWQYQSSNFAQILKLNIMSTQNQIEIISNDGIEIFEAQERASIDIQVATAKRWPRNLKRVNDNCINEVCLNKETAESCRYSKPVAGKNVVGVSVHLARIVVRNYGSVRVQQRIKQITDKTIIAEAVAFDMETNYAVSVEARRSILTKTGQRYSDNMIETAAMGILAIAERNAILKIIPKPIIDNVYNEAFKFANGDLSDSTKLIIARDKAFEYFKNEYAATEQEVCESVGVKTKEAVKADHIVDLRGFIQSLKDRELTIEELFNRKTSRETKETPIIQKEPETPEKKPATYKI